MRKTVAPIESTAYKRLPGSPSFYYLSVIIPVIKIRNFLRGPIPVSGRARPLRVRGVSEERVGRNSPLLKAHGPHLPDSIQSKRPWTSPASPPSSSRFLKLHSPNHSSIKYRLTSIYCSAGMPASTSPPSATPNKSFPATSASHSSWPATSSP